MNIPEDLKYTKDHEWIKFEANVAIVGITDFAQRELGDIVYIDVDTLEENLEREHVFGSVEAVKTVSDLIMPVSGKVIEFNEQLESNPQTVNTDPYKDGWIIKIAVSDNINEIKLLDAKAYREHIDL